jgi:hypothetical protein
MKLGGTAALGRPIVLRCEILFDHLVGAQQN